MVDVEPNAADPFEKATAAAVEDILAAIGAAEPAGAEHGAEAVGHGVIRLRDPASVPPLGQASRSGSAAAATVGHGKIRLRG